jgi:hypothetical protein
MKVSNLVGILEKMDPDARVRLEVGGDGAVHLEDAVCVFELVGQYGTSVTVSSERAMTEARSEPEYDTPYYAGDEREEDQYRAAQG